MTVVPSKLVSYQVVNICKQVFISVTFSPCRSIVVGHRGVGGLSVHLGDGHCLLGHRPSDGRSGLAHIGVGRDSLHDHLQHRHLPRLLHPLLCECFDVFTLIPWCTKHFCHCFAQFYSALTDWQNLYDDVAINSLYVFLCKFASFGFYTNQTSFDVVPPPVSRNYPHKDLSRRRPPISLIGIPQFASILLQLVLVAIFQSGMLFYTHEQPWFVPHNVTLEEIEDKSYECHDNLTMFGVLTFQYMVLCIIFAKGAPFRQPFYKNSRCAVCLHSLPNHHLFAGLLTIAMVVTFALTAYMIVIPDRPFEDFAEWFGVNHPDYPVSFRLQVVAAGLLQLALALFVEVGACVI